MSSGPSGRMNSATLTEGSVFRTLLGMAWPMLFGIVAVSIYVTIGVILVGVAIYVLVGHHIGLRIPMPTSWARAP